MTYYNEHDPKAAAFIQAALEALQETEGTADTPVRSGGLNPEPSTTNQEL